MKSYLKIMVCVVTFIALLGLGCQEEAETQSEDAQSVAEAKVEANEAATAAEMTRVEAEMEALKEEAVAAEKARIVAEMKTMQEAKEAEIAEKQKADEIAKAAKAAAAAKAESAAPKAAPKIDLDSVAITVNGVEVTEGQLEERTQRIMQRASKQMPPMFVNQMKGKFRKDAVEAIVAEQIIDQQIQAANITVTEEQVVAEIEKMGASQSPPLAVGDIKALIEAQGLSFDDWKKQMQFEKQLAFKELLKGQGFDDISVSDEQAQEHYDKNKKQFETPEQVKASHILIKPDTTSDPNVKPEQAKAVAKAKAEALLVKVRAGEDFAALAKESSSCPSSAQGGDLGFFGKRQMVPEFETAAFAMKPGQVSELVETQYGYHIIKLTDRKEASVIAFEEAKDNIVQILTQQQQSEIAVKYIDSLKAKADIAYAEGNDPAQAQAPASVQTPAQAPDPEHQHEHP